MDYLLADVRAWSRDWRAWALLVSQLLLSWADATGLLEDTLGSETWEYLVFVLVLGLSVVLGRPTLTLLLGIIALVATAASVGDLTTSHAFSLMLASLVSAVMGTALAAYVGVNRARAERRTRLVGSEGLFERTFTMHALPMMVMEPVDGRIVAANPAAEAFYGYPAGALLTMTVWDLTRSPREVVGDRLQAMAAGQSAPFEAPHRRADGSTRIVEVVGAPAAAEGLVVVSVHDVTEAVRFREDLAESRDLLAATLEAEPDLHVVLEPVRDESGGVVDFRFVEANAVACRAYGRERSAVVGHLLTEVITGIEVTDRFAMYREVAQTGTPVRLERAPTGEGVRLSGFGAWLDVLIYPAGRNIAVVIHDATNRVEAERELARSRDLLATTLDAEPDLHVVFEPVRGSDGAVVDLRYLEANAVACMALGLPREQIVGHLLSEVLPDIVGSPRFEIYRTAAANGEPMYLEQVPAGEGAGLNGFGPWIDVLIYPAGEFLSVAIHDATARVEAAQELERSRADYRLLSDTSADVVFRSVDGAITYISPAVTRLLGWSPQELLGQHGAIDVHPDDHAEVLRARERPTLDGLVTYVARLRRRDGTYVHCEVQIRAIDTSDPLHDVVGSIRDVTVRVGERNAREQALENLRIVLGSNPDAWVVARALYDRDGSIVDFAYEDANERAAQWYGLTLAELLSKTALAVEGPEGRDDVIAAIPVVTAGRPMVQDDVRSFMSERLGRGPAWIDIRATALPGDRMLYSWRDVTERHRQTEELQALTRVLVETEAATSALVDGAPSGTAYVRMDRSFARVNPALARMVGHDVEWLLEHRVDDILLPEDVALDQAMRTDILLGRATTRLERKRLLHADGHVVTALHSIGGVVAPDGSINGFVSQWIDITRQVAAEQALIESEQRFRLLADTATDWVFAADEHGTLTFVSGGYHTPLGLDESDLLGRSLQDLVHGDDVEVMQDFLQRVLAGQDAVVRVRHTTAGGGWRWVEIRGVATAGMSGAACSGGVRDIHAEHLAGEALADSERRFRLLAEQSSDVVLLIDDSIVRWASPSLERVLGFRPDTWQDRSWATHLHPDDREAAGRFVAAARLGGSVVERHRIRDSHGEFRWIEWHGGPYRDPQHDLEYAVVSFRIVDEQVAAEAELARRATTDDLTGLASRTVAIERLEDLADKHRRSRDRAAVFFIDLDHFKEVNDALGHVAGDAILVHVAQQLRATLRDADLIARMGGDEFLAIAPGVESNDKAREIGEKLLDSIKSPLFTPAGPIIPSASIGVTIAGAGENPDELIARADAAMYQAKQSGRGQVVLIPSWHT